MIVRSFHSFSSVRAIDSTCVRKLTRCIANYISMSLFKIILVDRVQSRKAERGSLKGGAKNAGPVEDEGSRSNVYPRCGCSLESRT